MNGAAAEFTTLGVLKSFSEVKTNLFFPLYPLPKKVPQKEAFDSIYPIKALSLLVLLVPQGDEVPNWSLC
jgi:hypothetical protein